VSTRSGWSPRCGPSTAGPAGDLRCRQQARHRVSGDAAQGGPPGRGGGRDPAGGDQRGAGGDKAAEAGNAELRRALLTGLIRLLRPPGLATGEARLNCDFHAIRHHGERAVLGKHQVPRHSQRTRGANLLRQMVPQPPSQPNAPARAVGWSRLVTTERPNPRRGCRSDRGQNPDTASCAGGELVGGHGFDRGPGQDTRPDLGFLQLGRCRSSAAAAFLIAVARRPAMCSSVRI
jgi:hypothetical protein